MKKALVKDCFKQIKKTNKRFLSILLMALLGVGFFVGIRASSPDMKLTIDKYFDDSNVYDVEILSTLGLTDEDINAVKNIDGVKEVYGSFSKDVLVDFDDEEVVIKILEENKNVNAPVLVDGRLTNSKDECIVDDSMVEYKNVKIGDYIEIKENLGEDESSNFEVKKLKVVGTAKSPIYISRDKGTSNLGSGKIGYIVYVNSENIVSDIYTEAYVIADGAKELQTISDEYDEVISKVKNNIEKIKEERQNSRYTDLINEANEKLNDAEKKLDNNKKEAEEKIADAEKELDKGKKEFSDGKNKIADAEKKLSDGKAEADLKFKDAEAQISAGETKLAESQIKLDDAKKEFEVKKQEATSGINQIDTGLKTIENQLKDLNENKELAESVLGTITQIDKTIENINLVIANYKAQISAGAENSAELQEKINEYTNKISELNAQKQELLNYGITQDKLIQITTGIDECNKQKSQLEKQKKEIEDSISAGETQIVNSQNQIAEGWNQIDVSKSQLAEEKNKAASEFVKAEKEIANGKKELVDAEKKITDGEKELNDKKTEFEEKIADAEGKLIDAREKVNDIENAKWYILDRYSNTGFNGYSQDTDNIAKIGTVFPVVFFLIAVLTSLTTMTRMVEEERTQIGTLKALRI